MTGEDPMRGTLGSQITAIVGLSTNTANGARASAEDVLGAVATWLLQRARYLESRRVSRFRKANRSLAVFALRTAAREIEREREEMSRAHG